MLLLKESTASSGNKAIAIGLIGGPIGIAAWSVGEAAAGAIAARLHDSGIHNDQLRQVGEELTSGSSALVLVIESHWTTAIEKDLVASGARVFTIGMAAEIAAQFQTTAGQLQISNQA